MRRYYLIYSEKGIVLSYKPLLITESLIVDKNNVYLCGLLKDLEKIANEINAKYMYFDETILPGFIDSHLHIDSLGFELEAVDLINIESKQQLLEKIRGLKPNIGEWIVCGRFDHLQFPDQNPPTRIDIDNVVDQYPVLLIHRSGHMGVLNTKGLEIVKNWLSNKYIDYNNGWVFESALWIIREYIFKNIDLKEKSNILLKTSNYLRNHGITSIGVAGCSIECLEALESIDNYLKTRVYVYLYISENVSDNLLRRVIEINSSLNKVRVNGFKIIIDGALGPRTAYLTSDYSDQLGNRGFLLHSKEWLENIVEKINNYCLQVAIHAIGDAALDIVLDIYRKSPEKTKIIRNRIEHASLVRDDQLLIIRDLKPVIVVQPHFVITDKWVLDRIGYNRLKWLYRYRSLYESTIISFSTDAPVEPVNPWRTIYAAVTRGGDYGLIHGKLTISERMSIIDSLHAYTKGSAYALRDDKLGCLYPGCYSDMIVVDKNPLEIIDPNELLNIVSKPIDLD